MVSAPQAWGSNAAVATVSTQLDATHFMPGVMLSPDGHSLYGYELTLANGTVSPTLPAEAGYLDVASRHFTPIGVASMPKCSGNSCQGSPEPYYLHCCQTDGRYLIALSAGDPGPDCGGCYWSYDLRSGALREVVDGNHFPLISTTLLDHGVFVFSSQVGIGVADLAAHTLTPLAGTTSDTQLDAFAWPYMVYGMPPGAQQHTSTTPTPLQVFDVATGATTALPQVTGSILALDGSSLYYVATLVGSSSAAQTLDELDNLTDPGAQPRVLATLPSGSDVAPPQSLAIDRDTLFYTVRTGLSQSNGTCLPGFGVICPTSVPAPPPVTTLYEVDNHSSSPRVRGIGSYAADLGDVSVANARLLALVGAVWDRAENRFVNLGTGRYVVGYVVGDFLVVGHSLSQADYAPIQVSIYDATHLPVLTN
jgi:hypothetical protein